MRRTNLEIYIEILENSTKNIKPTHLMQTANISWGYMLKRIDELKTKELIEEIELDEERYRKDKRTKIEYRTTEKGINILKLLKEVLKNIG